MVEMLEETLEAAARTQVPLGLRRPQRGYEVTVVTFARFRQLVLSELRVTVVENRQDASIGAVPAFFSESLGVLVVNGDYVRTKPKYAAIHRPMLIRSGVHQLCHRWLDVLPAWFVNGFADYVASFVYKGGPTAPEAGDVQEFLARVFPAERGRSQQTRSDDIQVARTEQRTMSHAKDLMHGDRTRWSDMTVVPQTERDRYWCSAFLLFCFFQRLRPGADVTLEQYVSRLLAGDDEDDVLEALIGGRPSGPTFKQLDRQIAAAYRGIGISIDFR